MSQHIKREHSQQKHHQHQHGLEGHRLHDAAESGQIDLVIKYLSWGDKVNQKDPHWKNTPLMYAAMKGHTEVARLLIGMHE